MKNKGFTLIELLFSMVMATIIVFVLSLFVRDILRLNYSAQSSMTVLLEGRKVLSVMVTEIRSAIPSALGSYPIESVSTSTVVFFTDVNSDDVADRVRYFLDYDTNSIKRGVILATGEPPAYTESETFSTIVTGVVNNITVPVFDFYTGDYAGTSTPLSSPINISLIRLIKITIDVDKDPNRPPEGTRISSQAVLRNLKDNI